MDCLGHHREHAAESETTLGLRQGRFSWSSTKMSDQHSRPKILERLADILVESFEVTREAIEPKASMKDDLGLDSIDAIDLAVGLEETEGVELSEDELRSIQLVGDVVDLVYDKLRSA
jgi:acyl carrier protein